MMIFWQEKLAFLAIPKTGSTAIEAVLDPYASVKLSRPPQAKHMTHKRFNRFIRPWLEMERLENVEVFAVMREPVSWLGSWYRYRHRDELNGSPNSTKGKSFDEFVPAYIQEENRPAYAALGSQAQQLSKKRGEIGIQHLFAYENMWSLWDFLEQRFAHRFTPPSRMSRQKWIWNCRRRIFASSKRGIHLILRHMHDFLTKAETDKCDAIGSPGIVQLPGLGRDLGADFIRQIAQRKRFRQEHRIFDLCLLVGK